MGLFKSLFTRPLEAVTPEPAVPIPESLPNMAASSADEIVLACQPQGPAEQAFNPGQTPAEYLGALQEQHLGDDMIRTLAHGMPDREGTGWAVRSARKVEGQLPPKERAAIAAADAWLADPSEANHAAAAQAADKAGLKGPGAWAAQAVAWTPALLDDDEESTAPGKKPRLAPQAVAAAVLMAAAISANPEIAPKEEETAANAKPPSPEEVAKLEADAASAAPTVMPPPDVMAKVRRTTFRSQQPFIADGVDIASGKVRV